MSARNRDQDCNPYWGCNVDDLSKSRLEMSKIDFPSVSDQPDTFRPTDQKLQQKHIDSQKLTMRVDDFVEKKSNFKSPDKDP